MCKFCENKFESSEGPYNLFRYDPNKAELINLNDPNAKAPDVKVFISGDEMYVINKQGLSEGIIPIVFCPICGEKLRNKVALIPL